MSVKGNSFTLNLKYTGLALLGIPLLPIMYFQGKKIRAKVPKLLEAQGNEGLVESPNGRKLKLITIGESTIAGVGVATHEEGFTGTLAKALSEKLHTKISWKVYARSGYEAKTVNQKLIPKITETEVDLIVIGLGANDAFTLNSPWRWAADIDTLILALKSKFGEAPIVFTNMPPIKLFPAFTPLIKFVMGNLVEILGEALNNVIQQHSNVYYDTRIISFENWTEEIGIQAEPSAYFSDGVHPSLLTYQIWAKAIAKLIIENETISTGLAK
ncbi:MAG: GDSL family lipase [Cytophagales bacterium CG12_big_fil_rev_8_21_14_0_65_40_12]|nr:MAG: GDSL family lipase [Cytophagales bacterium CG12_big_fil_rev_8_21_14_0_65_40_12]PIW04778.1 MAG: GDSL family lipase [Cytophagales bacterium CG17_big_fil_post_rev_8_21_14_2_50_40_13]